MQHKTHVTAGHGQHDILIKRDFDLPVELLYIAHTDPDIFAKWMTHEYGIVKVIRLDAVPMGGFRFETSDVSGNVVFAAEGVFHNVIENEKIVRTFEMSNSPFDVQLEFLDFIRLSDHKSRLSMHSIFRSGDARDQLLKLPFAQGLNMAHNRLQETLNQIKTS